jgi:hypothetical protein
MNTNDGGPAFPWPLDARYGHKSGQVDGEGMSLRDYFAAKAMISLLRIVPATPALQPKERAWIARDAYLMADDMLTVRSQK